MYFQHNYTIALLLTHIRDNFGLLTSVPPALLQAKIENPLESQHPCSNLTLGEFSLLLSDRSLGVKSEDEVISTLTLWLLHNIHQVDDRALAEDLMKLVNWPYVAFERLIELFKTFPRLRTNVHTKTMFFN